MRTLTATLVVPLVVAVAFALLPLLGSQGSFEGPGAVLATITLTYMLVLFGTACLVLPLRFFWRRYDFMRAWVSISMGVCIACALTTAFALFLSREGPFSRHVPVVKFLVLGVELAIVGAIGGYVFWAIARSEMRPDDSRKWARER